MLLRLLLSALLLGGAFAHAAAPRPNILLILTDDQGYGDLSCHGNPVLQTPNLDRLHAQSRRFTDFHVSPTCAPTRCALLTGRHEFKSGVTHTIFERERMSPQATTIAQVLQNAGYTTGIFGKWHLGDEPDRWPNRRGFDEFFIHGAGGIGQSYPGSCGDAPGNRYFNPVILHNGTFVQTEGYCTDVFFNQALRWIETRKDRGPFLACITPNAPHAPLDVPPEYEARYAGKVDANAAKFFGMIANIDDNVGRLLDRLRDWNLEHNTVVIFLNDNGGTAGVKVHNAGMRGAKGSPWLGGTRAASFWRWPGQWSPGDTDALAAHIDIFPTLAELAGAKLPRETAAKLDGRSLVSLLRNPHARWPERTLFTHLGRWDHGQAAQSKYRQCSVRTPQYQLVCTAPDGTRRWQLYDVKADPGEQHDLAATRPDVVQRLEADYDRWWTQILPCLENENLEGPTVNPFHELYWKQLPPPPIPAETMQRIHQTVQTPFKYGVILKGEEGRAVDCPSVFRHADRWYMTYIAFDGTGYETRLAHSDNLLQWEPLGTILRRGSGSWDDQQAAGYLALQDFRWNGTWELQKYQGQYWLSYLGGKLPGYETPPLSIGLASSTTPNEPREWNRLPENPVLQPGTPDARPFERDTLFKSYILQDPQRSLGYPFVMFYNARARDASVERIGMAVSTDLKRWRRFGAEPVVDNRSGITGDPQVVRIGDLWVMFYFGAFWRPDAFDTFACSKDLVHWTQWTGPDLIAPSKPWDKQYAHKPWVILHDGVVYHYYCAVGDQGRVLALATSKPLRKNVE